MKGDLFYPDMFSHVSDVDSNTVLAATLLPWHIEDTMKALTYSNKTVGGEISLFLCSCLWRILIHCVLLRCNTRFLRQESRQCYKTRLNQLIILYLAEGTHLAVSHCVWEKTLLESTNCRPFAVVNIRDMVSSDRTEIHCVWWDITETLRCRDKLRCMGQLSTP